MLWDCLSGGEYLLKGNLEREQSSASILVGTVWGEGFFPSSTTVPGCAINEWMSLVLKNIIRPHRLWPQPNWIPLTWSKEENVGQDQHQHLTSQMLLWIMNVQKFLQTYSKILKILSQEALSVICRWPSIFVHITCCQNKLLALECSTGESCALRLTLQGLCGDVKGTF